MKNSAISTLGAALATATLILVAFWPSNIDAVNDGQERTAEIAVPKLVVDDVEFTLVTHDSQDYAADQQPAFDLKAVNAGRRSAQLPVQIVMGCRSVPSPLSRVMPIWRPVWQERCLFRLNPGETRKTVLATGVTLPANSEVNVVLQTGQEDGAATTSFTGVTSAKNAILALRFSTAVQQNGPASSLSRRQP